MRKSYSIFYVNGIVNAKRNPLNPPYQGDFNA